MLELFSCPTCNKMTLVVQEGKGTQACCGKPMVQLSEKSTEAGKEKHVPVIEKIPGFVRIKIGGVRHPMEKEHYIQWIEVIGDTFLYTATFRPGDVPEIEMPIPLSGHVLKVRTLCNVHGIWAARP